MTIHYKEINERYILCGRGGFHCQSTNEIKDVTCKGCLKMLKVRGMFSHDSHLKQRDVVWNWEDTPNV